MDDVTWRNAKLTPTEHLGRACTRVESVDGMALGIADVELEEGVVELDLAVSPERGFHGVVWRVQDDENYESFFVRPHQVGNPDAIQYTPVFNGSSAWQLYHGDGFWAPVSFPLDDWFRIRVTFAGARAEVFVDDEIVLAIGELKRPRRARADRCDGRRGRVHVAGSRTTPRSRFAHRCPRRLPPWTASCRRGRCPIPSPRRTSTASRSPRARGHTSPRSRRVSSTSPA